jgi:hypothetical protein
MGAEGVGALLWLAWLVSCLFPYIKTVPLAIDTQPTSLVLGMAILLLARRITAPTQAWAIGVMCFAAFILFLAGDIDLVAVKAMLGYLSLAVFCILFCDLGVRRRAMTDRLVTIAIIVWFAVGCAQATISRDIFTFLISDARTTDNRGVVALAPEPTYYATHMLFMLVAHVLLGKPRKRIIALAVVSIIALAVSSQMILILGAALAATLPFFVKRRFFLPLLGSAVVLGMAVGLVIPLIDTHKANVRALAILDLLLDDPSLLLLLDASANERFASIFVSFKAFLEQWGAPHGLSGDAYYDVYLRLKQEFSALLWASSPTKNNLSGFGKIIFDLGWVAMIFVWVFVYGLARAQLSRAHKTFIAVAYGLSFLSALPLTYPLLGGTLGLLLAAGDARVNRMHSQTVGKPMAAVEAKNRA